jgi:hypothetical protein
MSVVIPASGRFVLCRHKGEKGGNLGGVKDVTQGSLHISRVLLIAGPAGAVSDAVKCQAAQLKEVGKYAPCRLKEELKAVKKGVAPDYTKCVTKFNEKWR